MLVEAVHTLRLPLDTRLIVLLHHDNDDNDNDYDDGNYNAYDGDNDGSWRTGLFIPSACLLIPALLFS